MNKTEIEELIQCLENADERHTKAVVKYALNTTQLYLAKATYQPDKRELKVVRK